MNKEKNKIKDALESIFIDLKERFNLRDFEVEEETDSYFDWLIVEMKE